MKRIIENWNKFREGALSESSFSRTKKRIDEENQPFLVISAARDDLGPDDMGNQQRGKDLKGDLVAAGYSFTQVFGAGQEEPAIDPETGKAAIDSETGEARIKRVLEVTQIVMAHQRGDKERPVAEDEVSALFELGTSLTAKYEQYAFIFGYLGDDGVMKIAAYTKSAPTYGMEHRIMEPWAGPWHTIRQAIESDQYWTKIAGTKGVFIEAKIKELEEMKTGHYIQKGWKTSQLLQWKSLL